MRQVIFIALYGMCSLFSFAQAADSVAADQMKTSFVAGLSCQSVFHYYGRTDSLNSGGFYPFAGIVLKNGLYANASFLFVSNKLATQYAASIAELGYQFANKGRTWSGNIFANAFFYEKSSKLIQSALRGAAGINLMHTAGIINLNLGMDIKVSNVADAGVCAGLDHIFRIDHIGKGVIVINPSAYIYAGTQRFTNTYYKEKNFLFLPAGQEAVTSSSSRFNILSYELSGPVVYGLGKMNIILSPAYVVPENLVEGPGEKNNNLFYLTATVRVTL